MSRIIHNVGKVLLHAGLVGAALLSGCGQEAPPAIAPIPKIDVDQEIRAKTKSQPLAFQEQTVGSATLEDLQRKFPEATFKGADDGTGFSTLTIFASADAPLDLVGVPLRHVDFDCWEGKLLSITHWYDSKDFEALEKGLQAQYGEGEEVIAGQGWRMWKTTGHQTMTLLRRAGTVWMKDDSLSEKLEQAKASRPSP